MGLVLLPFYRYQINPDGVSYMSIALKYAEGNIQDAVNGHFSPLFCLSLVPVLWCGFDPLLSVKLLNLAIGCVTILCMHSFMCRFRLTAPVRTAILVALIPVVLSYAYSIITPDLLVATLLILYCSKIFHEDYTQNPRQGLWCGALCALAYWAKSYSFPFLICHYPLMNVIHYFKSPRGAARRTVLRNFISGMLVFLIISSIWVAAISQKYGYLTLTTQSKHNIMLISPNPPKHPAFIPPPNETAVSVWEDPFYCVPQQTWNPFASISNLKYWAYVFLNNWRNTLLIFMSFSPLVFIACLIYILYGLKKPARLLVAPEILYPLILLIPYATGYCLLIVDSRYIWIICFLFMFMGGYVLNRLLEQKWCSIPIRLVLLVLFVCSFAVTPLQDLRKSYNAGKDFHTISMDLKQHILPGSKIASNTKWYETLYIAFHLRAKLFASADNLEPEELKQNLHTYNIDYFIEWENAGKKFPFLPQHERITNLATDQLNVYRLDRDRL